MSGRIPSVTLVRRIKATPARIYQAWTIPAQMVRWWGPDAGPTLSAEADVRVGGRFRVAFRMLDGLQRAATGVYRAVEPDRRLVMSWLWEDEPEEVSELTIELRPIPEGTELTLTHAQLPREELRDSHRAGWEGALNKLAALLETREATS